MIIPTFRNTNVPLAIIHLHRRALDVARAVTELATNPEDTGLLHELEYEVEKFLAARESLQEYRKQLSQKGGNPVNDSCYEVREYASHDGGYNPTGRGELIAQGLTKQEAEDMLSRLHSPEKCWAMKKSSPKGTGPAS